MSEEHQQTIGAVDAEPRVGELYRETLDLLGQVLDRREPRLEAREIGTVVDVGQGVARVTGLPNVRSSELLQFSGRRYGLAFNLLRHEVGCVLLDQREEIQAGSEVRRTGRVLDVPVGETLLGRVIDPVGRPLDELGPVHAEERRPVERPAPAIMNRLPVTVPLQTGLKVVDALVPIGRGQRELILGDRQTGKTGIAVDTMINQRDKDVICIYCAIGQQSTAVARVIDNLKEHRALEYSVVVVAEADSPPGLQFVAPYAATSVAEYFMDHGRDVLIVYDDLTTHARAYRELSLLLRRPPGREAFPGDIFYIHSRLLERSTHLRDELRGGSLTALPIAETEAQNVSAYIPTNLISITDGQVYLSPELFRKGVLPAVDVGRSVSRVGGKTQFPAYRMVAGDLRLSFSQFEELERFARFSSQLDEETRRTLAHGRHVREALKQPLYQPLSAAEQIAVLVAVTGGAFDELPIASVAEAEVRVRENVLNELPEICGRIEEGERLSDADRDALDNVVREAVASFREDTNDGDAADTAPPD